MIRLDGNETVPEVEIGTAREFTIIGIFMIEINETGLTKQKVQGNKLKVTAGDMISFKESKSNLYARLVYSKSLSKVKFINSIVSLKVNDTVFQSVEKTYNIPSLRVYLSKTFTHKLIQIRNRIGKVDFIVKTIEPIETNKEWYRYVQEFINEVRFIDGFYNSNYESINTVIKINAYAIPKITGTYMVTYNFDIPTLSIDINSTSGTSNIYFPYLSSGEYKVYVTAYNLINHVINNATFYVLDKIDGLMIFKPTDVFVLNKGFTLKTQVFNGTSVTLKVKFGDGSEKETFITNASEHNGNQTFQHTYTQCGNFIIQVEAMNNVTDVLIRNISVFVLCEITNLVVTTNPIPNSANEVRISLSRELEISISITSGSFVTYTVDWGDEFFELVKHTDKLIPQMVTLAHMYKKRNMYTLSVTATNIISSLTSGEFLVTMQNCSEPPVLEFNYGTVNEPVVLTYGERRRFVGDWSYENEDCEEEVSHAFSVNGCELSGDVEGNIEKPRKESIDYGIACIIEKRTLKIGNYRLTLSTTYENYTYTYHAFLKIIESTLNAAIGNGLYQSIPRIQKSRPDYQAEFYTFVLNGENSYDPDNPGNKAELTFRWFCRLTYEGNEPISFCNVSEPFWYPLTNGIQCVVGTPNAMLKINTVCFGDNATYIFMLHVSKTGQDGIRSNAITQEVTVTKGESPLVNLQCVTNCDVKVNSMERLVITYKCPSCFGRKIIAHWIIFNNNTQETVPFDRNGQANLIVKDNELFEGVLYYFKLMMKYNESSPYSTVVRLKMLTSRRPYGGSCEVTPTEGEAAKTKFRIICINWRADDEPLTYEFRYDTGVTSTIEMSSAKAKEFPLLNPSSLYRNEVSNVRFPLGLLERDYIIDLKIRIVNKYGTFAEWLHSKVKVTAPKFIEDDTSERNETTITENVFKKLKEFQPKYINDTQAVTSYIISIVPLVTNLNLQVVIPTMEPTVKAGVFGELQLNNGQKQKKEEAVEKLMEQKRKFKGELLDILANVPMSSIQHVKSVSDALSAVTANTSELSDDGEDKSINVMDKLMKVLKVVGMSSKIGAVYLEQSTKGYIQSISNILKVMPNMVTVKSKMSTDRQHLTSHNQKYQERARKSSKNVKKMIKTLDVYFDVISTNYVSSKETSRGKTDSFKFALKKKKVPDFKNVTIMKTDEIESNGVLYDFMLPTMSSEFEHIDPTADIRIENVNFKQNIFSWDWNTSSKIKSEVASLSLKYSNNHINVTNMSNPILININNKAEDIKQYNISLYMPGDLLFNKIALISEDCKMTINFDFINDIVNSTQFIVYIQYGKVPSSNDYDVKLNMSNIYGMIMTVSKAVRFPLNTGDLNNISSSQENGSRERNLMVRKIDNRTILMWNFSNFHWISTSNKLILFLTSSFDGPMPERRRETNYYTYDETEYRGSFNYSVRTFCSECPYWDENANKWRTDGCVTNPEETNLHMTSCKCDHLTAFGAFVVEPNPLPKLSLTLLRHGFLLLITVGTILLLYVIGLVVARRVDINDLQKIGVCPLLDNNPEDKYLYGITVNTGSQRNSGTKSNVFFNASGDIAHSGNRNLTDPEREPFQRNSSDAFVMATPNTIGDINCIRIWHDNAGGDWYLRNVEIVDLQTEEKFIFIATRWLSPNMNDGMLHCVLPVCGKEELQNFNYLFTNKSTKELSDAHIWFSIYARPPISSFTRCQRLSVAISILFCSMLSSCMFYKTVSGRPAQEENKIGGFSFRWQHVFIAIISACITVPVNVLLAGIFRIINPSSNTSKIIINIADESGLEVTAELGNNTENRTVNNATKKRKKSFHLPHWCLYPTWILCILVILTSAFFVVWYGMAFGNKKSVDWLLSVSISLVQDILLVQPLKIFAMALFMALIVKKVEEGGKEELQRDVKLLSKNESWLHKLQNEETIFDRMNIIEAPIPFALENMRKIRFKEMKMAAIFREIVFYFLFTVIVFMIGYNMRDGHAYNQTKDMKELLRLSIRNPAVKFAKQEVFGRLQSYQEFWNWTDTVLLPEIYPSKWYNLSERFQNTPKNNFPGPIFVNDLNSMIVNGVRIRQMRVVYGSCNIAREVRQFIINDCVDAYHPGNEEKRDFYYNWNKPMIKTTDISINTQNKPWRYQDSLTLDTYPISAKLHSYSGGGYVVELFPKFNNKVILDNLKGRQWIDRHTRAAIVEFAIYNAQSNYFSMIIIVFEFPPSGGLVHYSSVETFRLAHYTNETAFFVIGCYVLYLLFTLVFIIRELRILYRIGGKYFSDFWNLVEMGNIVLSILAIIFFTYLDYLKKKLIRRIPHKQPTVFINFHLASIWYECLVHVIALICFFVTLKFIKLLRFNKRISMLTTTLNAAWYPLGIFGIMFFIIIASVVFSTTIIFGHTLYGYRNWWGTLSAVISLLLGKFSYYQFEATNWVLGPIFFFTFNIMVNWIVMNMFISILNDVFAHVHSEAIGQDNEYEMLDYTITHLKCWLGYINSKVRQMEEIADCPVEENTSELNADEQVMLDDDQQLSSSPSSLQSNMAFELSEQENCIENARYSRMEDLFREDTSFLTVEDIDERQMDETVDKFIKFLVNLNDSNTTDEMQEL